MKDLEIMSAIQEEKTKEVAMSDVPEITEETEEIMKAKRIAIDQPNTEVKYDPLR